MTTGGNQFVDLALNVPAFAVAEKSPECVGELGSGYLVEGGAGLLDVEVPVLEGLDGELRE